MRLIIPAFSKFNIYKRAAKMTTALGPICVATSANKLSDWDVEVIDENNCRSKFCPKDKNGKPDHIKLQRQRPADVVGFYCSLTSTMPRVYELAALYKKMGIKTIAGGKHTDSLPEEALANNIDVVIFGDGEKTIQEFLNNRSLADIKGIAYQKDGKIIKTEDRPLINNLADLPFPDFNLLRYAKIKIYPVSWWRGCPFNCEFCAVKGEPRCSSAEKLFNLIVYLVETRRAKKFFLVDDHFGGNLYDETHRQEAIKFCSLIAEYQKKTRKKLKFSVQIRLNAAEYPELLRAMREAKIEMVCIGYESPIDEELIAMRKGFLHKDMVAKTRIFRQHGFFVHGMFIFGYPHKKEISKSTKIMPLEKKMRRFQEFIKEAKIDTIQILMAVPLPGTELRQRLIDEGKIFPLEQVGWEYYDGQFPLFEPDDGYDPADLQLAMKKIMSNFYGFRHFWKLAVNILFSFPLIIFPATLTLLTFKTRYIVFAFKWWRKRLFRNQSIKFGGWFVVKGWFKNFKKGDFLKKLSQAKHQLLAKKNRTF